MNIEVQPSKQKSNRERRAQIYAALGDPLRVGIVELLEEQDLSPDALAAQLDIPGNLLAHHLKVLQGAGIVERSQSRHDRRRTYVHLLPDVLEGLHFGAGEIAVPRVVFVCTHNSARSVLADALWKKSSGVPSTSAGTHPADRINPGAQAAAKRYGCVISQKKPQFFSHVVTPEDLVVSVCDSVNEELGSIPNAYVHWSIPDPASVDTDKAFDAAVADLQGRIGILSLRVSRQKNSITSDTRKLRT